MPEDFEKFFYLNFPNLQKDKSIIHVSYAGTSIAPFPQRSILDIIDEINEARALGKTKFIFANLSETIMVPMITKLHRVADKLLDIDSKNIILAQGSINSRAAYDSYADKTNRVRRIGILSAHVQECAVKNSSNEVSHLVKEYQVEIKSKKFVFFNKMARPHRILLAARMFENNLIDKSYFSFEGDSDKRWLDYVLDSPQIPLKVKQQFEKHKDEFPIRLNITESRLNPVNFIEDDIKYHTDSYFSLITETVFHKAGSKYRNPMLEYLDDIFITEKTYRAILFKHPFIIAGCPGSIKALQERGFKTFSPWIDESYDSIKDDNARLDAIVAEVERLCNFTDEQWIEWQNGIKEIVEHNFKFMFEQNDYQVY